MLSTGAYAGEQTRAEAAIAEAHGKIDAGDKAGAANQAPELQAQARSELRTAEDLLTHHHKQEALASAHHASELADQALASATSRRAEAEHARHDEQRDATSAAQQSAANANVRADNAQQETSMANMRANSAEQSSANANAQADAMRNAPPTTTTMEVSQHDTASEPMGPVHHTRHRVIHRHAHHVNTTTTVVSTTHP
jgi:hypothetical protein